MKLNRSATFLLIGLLLALLSVVCSTDYITPASLTATAQAGRATSTGISTAFYITPTSTTTPTPTVTPTNDPAAVSPTPEVPSPTITTPPDYFAADGPLIQYFAQSGDTLDVLAIRFGVDRSEIVSDEPIPEEGLIDPQQLLLLPRRLANTTPAEQLMPDSEVVYSPSAIGFDTQAYVEQQDGHLHAYQEFLGATGFTSGADILQRVAIENSINPRLLLSLLEYLSHWVSGEPGTLSQTNYPMGLIDVDLHGLYQQLTWAVNLISKGYYGWREGNLTEIQFKDGSYLRIAPELNAGTVALQFFFAQLYDRAQWEQALDPESGYLATYKQLFGNPQLLAAQTEPLFPSNLSQPSMILPFMLGQVWSFTGGPHGAWEGEGSQAALDFAPSASLPGCAPSDLWVTAVAPGYIVRSGGGVVVLDLDDDQNEQTGWVLMYLHVSENGAAPVGRWVDTGEPLGHPSCEGGRATGTHVHIARKYNGEWIAADGPIPFVLSGWQASAGDEPYDGTLTRDGEVIVASRWGEDIARSPNDP